MVRKVMIQSGDCALWAYVSVPRGRRPPAIAVVQEIFGINHRMRNVADSPAEEGRTAVAPHLF